MQRRPLIIDCDPGVDDATALLLAFASPEFDILGITVVAGNVGLESTVRNACLIRQIARREDVPVFAGCARPMVRDVVNAGAFHGETGLGDLPVADIKKAHETEHAVGFTIRTLMESPAPVTLAVTGPATNIAMALVMEPRIAGRIAEIVFMGGARAAGGNITPSAEFNVFADPHAAHVMLGCGAPIAMFGLDATYQVLSTSDRVDTLAATGANAALTAAALMRFSNNLEHDPSRKVGAPLHDPCTIAYLIKPELFALQGAKVSVETNAALSFGHTAVDFRVHPDQAVARWAYLADGEGVFELLTERLGRS